MYPGIDLRLLRYAVGVAEELNFSAAAKRLHIAQPALSRAIRQLEDQIGVPLFLRSSRKVALTEAGREFVYEARKALHYSERASEVIRRRKAQSSPKLVIGYPPQFGARFIIDLSKISLSGVPALKIVTRSSFTAEILENLKTGKFAAGIVAMPDQYAAMARLKTITLYRYPIIAALLESHPLTKKQILSMDDLRDVPLIVTSRQQNPALYEWFKKQCSKAGFVPKIARQVKDPHEYGAMIFHGEGVGIGVGLSKTCPITRLPDNVVVRAFQESNLVIETAFVFGERFKSGPLKAFPAAVQKCWNKYKPDNSKLSQSA
jgi:DNA-binding transcriptional LysR family regulator